MKGYILVLTNNLFGLHSFRKEVMKAIVDEGYELYISAPNDDKITYFEDIGCHVVKTDFNRRGMNPVADLKLLLTYRKLINRLKPQSVLTYTIKPNIYGGIACRLTRTPQIANITGLGDALENGGWLQKLTVSLYKIGIGRSRHVFFQNRANRDFCVKHGITKKDSSILPGSGVNLGYHSYQDYPSDGVTKFLFIGRLLKDKGIEEFFQMSNVIKKNNPNTEFQIIGPVEGMYQEQLDKLVKMEVIKYIGTTPDVRPYIGRVHCTIMPSYHEGMSNVNLESAANGRPVITTNVPGCRETVDDGRTGILVKPKDAQDLICGVERFLALPYEQKKLMGLEARKKVEREFDRQIVVKAYLDAINVGRPH